VATNLDEQHVRLTFSNAWSAVKWDAPASDPPPHPYRDGIEHLKGELDGASESTKAVDVVAVSPAGCLYLIELKDFRTDYAAGGVPRALAFGTRWKDLPLEVALKVRDTLAGVCGVLQRDSPATIAEWIKPALGKPVRVVALIAQTKRASETAAKRTIRNDELLKNLRRKLAWLTENRRHVLMLDPGASQSFPTDLDGLSAASLP